MRKTVLLYPDDSGGSGGQSEAQQDLDDLTGDVGSEDSDSEDEPDEEAGAASSEDDDSEEDSDGSEEAEEDSDDSSSEDETQDEDKEQERRSQKEPDEERITPLSVRAIKEKYPNFFKDFPGMRAAFFEHPKYQELFPDVQSAESAARKAEEFDALEQTLVEKGDPSTLLKVLSENNPKALRKVVSGFADSLRQVDDQAYTLLAQPIIEELLYHANAHGLKIGNKNLQLSARHLANFVFANGGDIPDISRKTGKPAAESEAEKELATERAKYAQEKFSGALDEIGSSISSEMNKFLDHKMDGLSSFERKQIIKEARVEIDRILSADKGFQNVLAGLWKRAKESGYSAESKSRLRRAWLDRARLIAPKIRAKYKQEALSARSGSSGNGNVQKRQFPAQGGKVSSQGQRTVLDPKKIDWRKTSDMDILNSK